MANKIKINNELLEASALCYADSKVRRSATTEQRQRAINAYNHIRLANERDNGRHGKVFENELNFLLNPRTSKLRVAKPSVNDITLCNKSGQRVNLEAKTGAGNLAYALRNPDITIDDVFSADYYAFNPFYSKDQNLNDTVIMTREAFIVFLVNSPGKWYAIKHNTDGTFNVSIQNFFVQKGRKSSVREQYFRHIHSYALANPDSCWYIDEFLDHLKGNN